MLTFPVSCPGSHWVDGGMFLSLWVDFFRWVSSWSWCPESIWYRIDERWLEEIVTVYCNHLIAVWYLTVSNAGIVHFAKVLGYFATVWKFGYLTNMATLQHYQCPISLLCKHVVCPQTKRNERWGLRKIWTSRRADITINQWWAVKQYFQIMRVGAVTKD